MQNVKKLNTYVNNLLNFFFTNNKTLRYSTSPFLPIVVAEQLAAQGKEEQASILLHAVNDFMMDALSNCNSFSEILFRALNEHDWVFDSATILKYAEFVIQAVAKESLDTAEALCHQFNTMNDLTNDVFTMLPDFSLKSFLIDNWVPLLIGSTIVIGVSVCIYYYFFKEVKEIPINNPQEIVVDNVPSNIVETNEINVHPVVDMEYSHLWAILVIIILFVLCAFYKLYLRR